MPVDDSPTGVTYLKTFQALFQIIEFLALFVTWSLVASQAFYVYKALAFALGVFIFVWFVTIFFFVMYITGFNQRLNDCCSRIRAKVSRSGAEPSPFSSDWYVAEYCIYLLLDIFLLIAAIIISAFPENSRYIAAIAFGWFSFLVYSIHFCLLVKTTEGIWPHSLAANLYSKMRRNNSPENAALMASQPPVGPATEP